MWTEGIKSGHVEIVVPEVPPVDLGEVSDAELTVMSGGTTYCCCPCCTCTE